MKPFNLPKSTEFGRVIPKNAFNEYTNSKQKKLISDSIQRITWTNKLSEETTNLKPGSVIEIQVFQIKLKQKNDLKKILELIDKSIPYHIIFFLIFDKEVLLSTSAKHNHISKLNESVLDCTFRSSWINIEELKYELVLNESLDQSYITFCNQITTRTLAHKSYQDFVESEMGIKELENKILKIESQLRREKQFNKKVSLNLEMSKLQDRLKSILDPSF